MDSPGRGVSAGSGITSVHHTGCEAPPNTLGAVNTLKYCAWRNGSSPFFHSSVLSECYIDVLVPLEKTAFLVAQCAGAEQYECAHGASRQQQKRKCRKACVMTPLYRLVRVMCVIASHLNLFWF